MSRPLAIDLFCGLGGWTEGFLAEGWNCVGFDIERHRYGRSKYPAQLILQDVLTLHGAQFSAAAIILASPPCQRYSWLAMPWSRSKTSNSQAAKALRQNWEINGPDNRLFDACFRIQSEAIEASGRYIPLIVENVRGAQPWVGQAAHHYGSFYLWGDVPRGCPTARRFKTVKHINKRDGHAHTRHLTNPAEHYGIKQHGSGRKWFDVGIATKSSKSLARKRASALVAKIPFELSSWVARYYRPSLAEAA